MNNFEKEAQKRSITKTLGRALNPMEWVRQMSSSKYRRMITAVDAIDKVMRDNILRQQPELRNQLHQARMAMKNREFLKVFQHSNYIVDSVNSVFADQIGELDALGREIYSEFSNDKMDEAERKQLEEELGIHQRTASIEPELVIEAGVTQWLQEKIPTRKEIEGTLFDKIFKNMQGKQQEAARQALAIAERTFDFIKVAFETLDSERRNIMEYVRLARDYQKKLGAEKDRLKKMYLNYFPPEPTPVEPPKTQEPPPPAQAPAAAQQTPLQPPSSQPILPGNPPPEKANAVNDMVANAKGQISNGRIGIGIALLAKASELCDEVGDEQRSISLLKVAADLDNLRGKTIDVFCLDDARARIIFSKERIAEAFNRGYRNSEIDEMPKLMIDGKEI